MSGAGIVRGLNPDLPRSNLGIPRGFARIFFRDLLCGLDMTAALPLISFVLLFCFGRTVEADLMLGERWRCGQVDYRLKPTDLSWGWPVAKYNRLGRHGV